MVDGFLYEFNTFAGNIVGGINQDDPGLDSTANPVPAQTHKAAQAHRPVQLRQLQPPGRAIAATDTVIALADVSALPDNGYVKIDNEVLAYNARNTAANTISITSPAYRRGCYNTTAADHNADAMVRLLPVRELDRYRVDGHPLTGTTMSATRPAW